MFQHRHMEVIQLAEVENLAGFHPFPRRQDVAETVLDADQAPASHRVELRHFERCGRHTKPGRIHAWGLEAPVIIRETVLVEKGPAETVEETVDLGGITGASRHPLVLLASSSDGVAETGNTVGVSELVVDPIQGDHGLLGKISGGGDQTAGNHRLAGEKRQVIRAAIPDDDRVNVPDLRRLAARGRHGPAGKAETENACCM